MRELCLSFCKALQNASGKDKNSVRALLASPGRTRDATLASRFLTAMDGAASS